MCASVCAPVCVVCVHVCVCACVCVSDPPGEDEVRRALRRLSVGKAGGDNGVLPDLLKCCGDALVTHIVTLFTTVWREQRVPAEWRDALLVPVPKKEDLSLCDNW